MPARVRSRFRPGRDCAVLERLRIVRDHQRRVNLHRDPQPGAGRTGPVRAVERKRAGLDLAQREHVARAGQLLRIDPILVLVERADPHQPLAELQRLLDAVRQPTRELVLFFRIRVRVEQRDPVDHHVDRVALVFLQRDLFIQREHLAVDPRPHEPARTRIRQHLLMLAFAVANDRGEHQQSRLRRQREHAVDHLLNRLLSDRVAADRAMRPTRPREQQPQVVVDLGHRPDRRAGVARAGLLVNRDRRREALDVVHIGLLHAAQKLPCVGRERLDVATLPLGVDRVERQRRLARAREPGDHHEPVPWDRHVDVFEVVFAGAADHDLVGRHERLQIRAVSAGSPPTLPAARSRLARLRILEP